MASRAAHAGDESAAAKRRVLAAIGLIAFAAFSTILWPIQTWGQIIRAPGGDEVTLFLAHYQRLAPYLPAKGSIGYIVRTEEAETRKTFRKARLELLQYALAPRMIEKLTTQGLVIFDSDDPEAYPEAGAQRDWELVADLHDGLKVYRLPGHE